MPERHKWHRTVHIEAMKAWIEPTLSVHHIRTVLDQKHEIPDYIAQTIEDDRSLVRPVHPDHQPAVIDVLYRYSQIMGSDLTHASKKHFL